MPVASPQEGLQALFAAFNKGDIDALVALYEPGASMVAQPGQVATGTEGVREVMAGFLAMKPTLTSEKNETITAGDLALSVTKWTLKGTDPNGQPIGLEGTATDVLRKQVDGSWLFVIDNPWGDGIVG
jgi:uncharacterized protein (TIGR02246 family)